MKSKIYQPRPVLKIYLDNKPTTDAGVKLVDMKLPADWMTAAATGQVDKGHWLFSDAAGGFGVVKPSDFAKANMELKPGESVISKTFYERLFGKPFTDDKVFLVTGRRQGKTAVMQDVAAAFTKVGYRMADFTEHLIKQNFDKFQARVRAWVDAIGFKMGDKQVRLRRFAEEAAELCQAGGLSYEDFAFITLDAYRRPVGEVGQEIGGVSMTLFALAEAHEFSVGKEAMRELRRVEQPAMIEKIRAKQIEKEARGV